MYKEKKRGQSKKKEKSGGRIQKSPNGHVSVLKNSSYLSLLCN